MIRFDEEGEVRTGCFSQDVSSFKCPRCGTTIINGCQCPKCGWVGAMKSNID